MLRPASRRAEGRARIDTGARAVRPAGYAVARFQHKSLLAISIRGLSRRLFLEANDFREPPFERFHHGHRHYKCLLPLFAHPRNLRSQSRDSQLLSIR